MFRKLTEDLFYTGVNDRRIELFENAYPVANGVSYNSYVLLDEKVVLFDTADGGYTNKYLENVKKVLAGRKADYLLVSHMEPDHSASMRAVLDAYPDIKVICNAKSKPMIENFFGDISSRAVVVSDGEEFSTGKHTLKFVFAPMVHWPEVMLTLDVTDNVLFSADAFGSFGAIDGNLYSDEVDFDAYLPEARRYYTNIVGKYGAQVKAALKKLAGATPALVCPLHGVIWRNNFDKIVEKYLLWADYEPEEVGVVVCYGSVYGNTADAAETLAATLAEKGVTNVKVYDVAKTHYSHLIAEAFRASNLVFCSVTTNMYLYAAMEKLLDELTKHGIKKRAVSLIQNGSWAAASGARMKEIVSTWKDSFICGEMLSLTSRLKETQAAEMDALAEAIKFSMARHEEEPEKKPVDPNGNALFNLSYGLFVLSTKLGDKDNGCIVNTVQQVADGKIAVSVNKKNFTCEMLQKTDDFCVSILSEKATFDTFTRFGFQSGRAADKFDADAPRMANGVCYYTDGVNAVLCGKIVERIDCGSHILFIAELGKTLILTDDPSCTYAYYFAHIKPAPPAPKADEKKKGFVCKICGYVYEGETLPEDFVCPLCKHPASDFEPL